MSDATRWAIVTGGASGIGRAIALRLARQDWHVALADRDLARAEEVVREIAASGGQGEAHELDVAHSEKWDALVARLRADWPCLDLVVNAAGNLLVGPIVEMSPGEMSKLVEVNLLGTMIGTRACLPWLIDSAKAGVAPGSGMLNIASIFAQVSPPGFAAYNATKAGVIAWTEALRGEMAPWGLNATVVLPGVTPTRLFARASYPSPVWRQMCDRYLAGAELTADQVAATAIAGMARGQLYVVVGRRAKLYARLKRIAPAWLIDRVGRLAQQQLLANSDPIISTIESSPLPCATTAETS
jgi:short-subunit dehydrogenase